jgi:hypothetical protein
LARSPRPLRGALPWSLDYTTSTNGSVHFDNVADLARRELENTWGIYKVK